MTAWLAFAAELSGEGTADAAFVALNDLVQEEIGARLVTFMTFDDATGMATRAWSNMPDAYPPQGSKPPIDTEWSQIVLVRRQPFIANTIEEIACHFPDHPLIQSLGCESCLNLPVVHAGRLLGTLNLLDVKNHFTPQRVERAACLVAPAILSIMRASETNRKRVSR